MREFYVQVISNKDQRLGCFLFVIEDMKGEAVP